MQSPHVKRLATAAVLLPLLALVLLQGGWAVVAGVLLVSTLASWEYFTMFWAQGQGRGKKFIGLGFCALIVLAAATHRPNLVLAVMAISLWASHLFFLFSYSRNPDEAFYTNAAIMISGLLYIPVSLQFLLTFSRAEIILVILAGFASDTGAYYAGRFLGRARIWPAVSPKKTWAGSGGGLVLCVAATTAFAFFFLPGEPLWWWAVVGVLLNLAAQLGDFFESALKRWLGVKDSGHMLPGHGGMLDRIDSLLLAIPVYAACRGILAIL
jgi:phosphatidate cytidylyltransferase